MLPNLQKEQKLMQLEGTSEEIRNLADALGQQFVPIKDTNDHSAAYAIVIPVEGFILRFWIDERNHSGTLKIRRSNDMIHKP